MCGISRNFRTAACEIRIAQDALKVRYNSKLYYSRLLTEVKTILENIPCASLLRALKKGTQKGGKFDLSNIDCFFL